MSPPHILLEEDYSKPLHNLSAYFDYSKLGESKSFYNHREGFIFRLQEVNALSGSEYCGCVEIYACNFNEMALNGINDVTEDFLDPFEAASKALEAFEPDSETLIGRYTFKNFKLEGDCIGKQIKGAFVHPEYQQSGISSFTYRYLTKKYGFLVSDNNQTYKGHMLWTLSILKWGVIKIYDCVEERYIGMIDYTQNPCPIKPWSVPYNFPMQNEKFLREDMCDRTDVEYHHIVLVADGSMINNKSKTRGS